MYWKANLPEEDVYWVYHLRFIVCVFKKICHSSVTLACRKSCTVKSFAARGNCRGILCALQRSSEGRRETVMRKSERGGKARAKFIQERRQKPHNGDKILRVIFYKITASTWTWTLAYIYISNWVITTFPPNHCFGETKHKIVQQGKWATGSQHWFYLPKCFHLKWRPRLPPGININLYLGYACVVHRMDTWMMPAVLPFSKLNNFIFGYFDPENIFLDNENK